jgi:hypothetical protein
MNLEWQEDESYLGTYQGKKIRYYQLSTPPDIADSAITAISTYDSDIVFFKLCFADFNGEQDNLVENKRYVEEIYSEVVTKKHKKLIIGNALPQIAQDTTSEIKQEHQAYNSWLSNFAATHQHAQILDLYGMLSNSNGALKPEYAVGDSHLNDNAYAKITPALIQAINNAQ